MDQPECYVFLKSRSYVIKLISYDKMMSLADEGKASDVDCLDFSKAFGIVSHSIFLEKLLMIAWTSVQFVWWKTGKEALPHIL